MDEANKIGRGNEHDSPAQLDCIWYTIREVVSEVEIKAVWILYLQSVQKADLDKLIWIGFGYFGYFAYPHRNF